MKNETNRYVLTTSDIIYLCLHWYEDTDTDRNERTKDVNFFYRTKLRAIIQGCIREVKIYGYIPNYSKGRLEATIEIIRDIYNKQWIYTTEIWKLENIIEKLANK